MVTEKTGSESRLVIINDGSRDETGKIAELEKLRFENLIVINKNNSGHGPTCLYGYKYAVNNNADFVFQTDSDGQTRAEDFWQFWEERNNYDFVIGFRPKRGDGLGRWLVSRILRLVLFIIFKTYVKDANTPFRLMNAGRLKKYTELIPDDFFLANVLLVVLLQKNKEKMKWLKINFAPRDSGVPSVSFIKFFKVGLKTIKDFNTFKQKI